MAIFQLGEQVPRIGNDAWISESSQIIGNVEIADGASVWPGAVLRGDLEKIYLDSGSNIQDNAVVHVETGYPCIIGKNVSVGHAAVLHGCTIEEGALIGMGAIILNGAHIGRNAVVGAGALVAKGKTVEEGALVVGCPARFVRKLTDEEISRTLKNTTHYADQARLLRTALKRLD